MTEMVQLKHCHINDIQKEEKEEKEEKEQEFDSGYMVDLPSGLCVIYIYWCYNRVLIL